MSDTSPQAPAVPPSQPAGWHPDPQNPAMQRYWDGNIWTDHTAPAVAAHAAPAAVAPAAPAVPRIASASLAAYPGFWMNLITLGIARARWVSATNKTIGQGGAGALFAYFLLPFAQYGVTDRLNGALRAAGSGHQESPILVFFLTGWPFIGSKKRLGRGVRFYNDAGRVRAAS